MVTPPGDAIRQGCIIDFRISVRGISFRWRTLISEWDPPFRFADVQLRGAYKLWHHVHLFQEVKDGALCVDRVRCWPRGGRLINRLFVRRDVGKIFEFRKAKLRERFEKVILGA